MGYSRKIGHLVGHVLACCLLAAGFWVELRRGQNAQWRSNLEPAPATEPAQPSAEPELTQSGSGIHFDDIANQTGVDFSFYDGAEGNLYIVETTGGGVAVLDYDNDGQTDLFFPNGTRLRRDGSDDTHTSHLYANRTDLGFEEVSRQAGVDLVAYAQGAAVIDYDNDGLDDILVTCFGKTVLYHNVGDGTFLDVSDEAGVSNDRWSTSAAAADLDSDGALDLYVCAYGDVALDEEAQCLHKEILIHCGPQKFRPQPDLLFRNSGDGRFRELARGAGMVDETGRGLAVAIADLTGDGRPDIFVANDSSQHFLFVNLGDFSFQESGLALGVALNAAGHYMAGMSAACADFDRNGWLDLFVTNFYGARSAMYRNLGRAGFFDCADTAGLAAPSNDRLGFGTVFLDADLDGNPDLLVANGHVSNLTAAGIPYKMKPQFFRNQDAARFQDESNWAGPFFQRQVLGRGIATGDIDDDGRPDAVVCHIGEPAAVLVNRTVPHGHWLGLKLIGTETNRSAINAKVRVELDDHTQTYEVGGGGTYLSSSDRRLIIGLGAHRKIQSLEVEWPSSQKQHWDAIPIDQYHRIVEPSGMAPGVESGSGPGFAH